MTIAYLDTHSGISGDMTLAALVDAGADRDYLLRQIQSLGLPSVALEFSETHRGDFRALRLDVKFPAEHVHRRLQDIEQMIARSQMTQRERDMAVRMFRKLGAAPKRRCMVSRLLRCTFTKSVQSTQSLTSVASRLR